MITVNCCWTAFQWRIESKVRKLCIPQGFTLGVKELKLIEIKKKLPHFWLTIAYRFFHSAIRDDDYEIARVSVFFIWYMHRTHHDCRRGESQRLADIVSWKFLYCSFSLGYLFSSWISSICFMLFNYMLSRLETGLGKNCSQISLFISFSPLLKLEYLILILN